MYGNDYVELVCEKGRILVQGGSSIPSGTRKRPSCIGYSVNPPSEANDEYPCITKRARFNTLYSLFDSNSHQTPQDYSYPSDFKYTTKSNGNKLEGKKSNSKPTWGTSQLCSSNSIQKHELGSDQRMEKVNFSNFLRPALFFKSSNYQLNSATATQPSNGGVLAREEGVKNSKAMGNSVVIDSSANKGSNGLMVDGVHHREDQAALDRHKAKATPNSVAKGDDEGTLPDEQSDAIGHDSTAIRTQREKGKSCVDDFSNGPLMASSSLCSLEASNDPTFLSRKHEDTEDSNFTSDNDEEAEDVMNTRETPPREDSRGKKMRNPAIHNLSERKRRDKINKKMRALKELIPNCNKMDKASMLDDAIEYLKTLKLQLQVMSMGSGLCSMPIMMLGGGMNIRPGGIGIACSLPPQFPNVPQMAASHITENRLQMLPFPNQMLPIQFPMSHPPPFIPLPPKHLPTPNDFLPNNSDLNAQLLCPMQPSNQGTN